MSVPLHLDAFRKSVGEEVHSLETARQSNHIAFGYRTRRRNRASKLGFLRSILPSLHIVKKRRKIEDNDCHRYRPLGFRLQMLSHRGKQQAKSYRGQVKIS